MSPSVDFARFAAYVVAAWLTAIALILLTTGQYFDVAVRDLVIAVAAYVLGRLSQVRDSAPAALRTRAA